MPRAKKETDDASSPTTPYSPKKSKLDPATNQPFSEAHKVTLVHAIIDLCLRERPNLYKTPGLEDVAGNGGDKINKSLQQYLVKLCKELGEDGGYVKASVAAARRKK